MSNRIINPTPPPAAEENAHKDLPPRVTASPSRMGGLATLLGFSWLSYVVTVLVFEVAFFLVFTAVLRVVTEWFTMVAFFVIIWITTSILHLVILVLAKVSKRVLNHRKLENEIDFLQEQLETGDFFTTLIRINFRYIDKYYLQTQVQADKSFYLSAAAAIVSLIMILAGIGMMFVGKTNPALLTTASGVLGECIASVFFFLYNRTVSEMSKYHQKLVLTQNISLALKMAEQLPDSQKSTAQMTLIECLSRDINMYLCADGRGSASHPATSREPNG
jgi:hypothetical protein